MISRQVSLALGLSLALAGGAAAAPAPQQRGEVEPPTRGAPAVTAASPARALVTLCGLAVVLVEDSADSTATLYAGPTIDQRLSADPGTHEEFELAEVYTPIAEVCEVIRAEHERILRSREARRGE